MRRAIRTLAMALLFSAFAWAHGNDQHVMGKVTKISDNSITVQTSAKQTVRVVVSDQTKFEKSGWRRLCPT